MLYTSPGNSLRDMQLQDVLQDVISVTSDAAKTLEEMSKIATEYKTELEINTL